MSQEALVTGASGFVGGTLAAALAQGGWAVTALLRADSDDRVLRGRDIRIVTGDLSDPDSLDAALQGGPVVFHCAGLTGIGHARSAYREVMVDGTRHLLQAAIRAGVRRLVFVSSVLACDLRRSGATVDECAPYLRSSLDPYGLAKAHAERLLMEAHHRGELSLAIVRPVFVYGPGDRPGGFLPEMVHLLARRRLRLFDGGRVAAPLIHVADLTRLLIACGTRDAAHGQIYNAAHPETITWRQLLHDLAEGLDLPRPGSLDSRLAMAAATVLEALARMGAIGRIPLTRAAVELTARHHHFPGAKARKELGFTPEIPYREGLVSALPMLREQLAQQPLRGPAR